MNDASPPPENEQIKLQFVCFSTVSKQFLGNTPSSLDLLSANTPKIYNESKFNFNLRKMRKTEKNNHKLAITCLHQVLIREMYVVIHKKTSGIN